nr:MAG TPA: hypothetical protein [Caudoviricetes sp.]
MNNIDGNIENITDQLEGFTQEVESVVSDLVRSGYTIDQAIAIVKIGVEDIKAETMHQFNHRMYAFTKAYEERTSILERKNEE